MSSAYYAVARAAGQLKVYYALADRFGYHAIRQTRAAVDLPTMLLFHTRVNWSSFGSFLIGTDPKDKPHWFELTGDSYIGEKPVEDVEYTVDLGGVRLFFRSVARVEPSKVPPFDFERSIPFLEQNHGPLGDLLVDGKVLSGCSVAMAEDALHRSYLNPDDWSRVLANPIVRERAINGFTGTRTAVAQGVWSPPKKGAVWPNDPPMSYWNNLDDGECRTCGTPFVVAERTRLLHCPTCQQRMPL